MQWPVFKKKYANTPKKPRKKPKPVKRQSAAMSVLRKQIFIGLGSFVVVGLLLTAVWYGTRIDAMQIKTVEIVGGRTIAPELLEEKAQEVLQGDYYRLVPRTFSWWYPQDEMLDTLAAVSRVKEVRVVDYNKQVLQIAFTEYEPAALWCGEVNREMCLFLDSVGFAFSPAPSLTGSALVRYFTDDEPTEKSTAVSAELMRTVQNTIDRLEGELGLYVTEVTIDDIDISYTLATGGEIKVTTRMSVNESIANLVSILSSDDFSSIADGSFFYIDLRFGDKVFVSESEVVASSTNATSTNTQ